jgi:hypothetical protein
VLVIAVPEARETRHDGEMAERYRTADGWSVEVVRLTGTQDHNYGEWLRVNYFGYHVECSAIATDERVPAVQVVAALGLPGIGRLISALLGRAFARSSLLMHDSGFGRDGDLGSAECWSGGCGAHGACRGCCPAAARKTRWRRRCCKVAGAAVGTRVERWLHGRAAGAGCAAVPGVHQ